MNSSLVQRILDAPALLFDLDGVIANSAPLHMHAYEETFSQAGLIFPDTARSMVRCGAARSRVLAQALGDTNHPQFSELHDAKEHFFRALLEQRALQPIPGAPEFVRRMKQKGKRLGLVTSSRAPLLTLAPLGLEDMFDVTVDATDVPIPKPHPGCYQLATKRLGLVASECVAFEDSPEGVASATAAGLEVIGVGTRIRDDVSLCIKDFHDGKLAGHLILPKERPP